MVVGIVYGAIGSQLPKSTMVGRKARDIHSTYVLKFSGKEN